MRTPWFCSSMAATTASVAPPFCSTGPTQSRAPSSSLASGPTDIFSLGKVDEDVTTLDPHAVAHERGRFRIDAASRQHVVLPSVRGAGEHRAIEPSLAETHSRVATAILVGANDASHVDEEHRLAADLDADLFAAPNVVDRCRLEESQRPRASTTSMRS